MFNVTSVVHQSTPPPPPTPLNPEGWNLACKIPTWMAQKLPNRFFIFCQEAEKIKFKALQVN